MQKIVIDIPDKKLGFFMELFRNLGITSIKKLSAEQKNFVEGLNDAVQEAEEDYKGNKNLQNARDFLEEL